MKTTKLLLATAVIIASVSARAQEPGSKFGVGARIDMVPSTTFDNTMSGQSQSQDGTFGFGIGVVSEYRLHRYFKAGLDFMYYTLKNEKAEDRTGIIGIGPRLTAVYPFEQIGPFAGLDPYVFITFGFSSASAPNTDAASGFWLQGGAGAEARLGDALGFFAELAYEGGFYSETKGVKTDVTAFGFALGGKYHF